MSSRENDFSRLELSYRACLDNYRYFRSKLKPKSPEPPIPFIILVPIIWVELMLP